MDPSSNQQLSGFLLEFGLLPVLASVQLARALVVPATLPAGLPPFERQGAYRSRPMADMSLSRLFPTTKEVTLPIIRLTD